MTDEIYLQLKLVGSWYYNYRYYTEETFVKVYTTEVTKELLANFKNKIADPDNNKLKYLMFSGHDDNVFPFMRAHNLTSAACMRQRYIDHVDPKQSSIISDSPCYFLPGFASSFLWELSKKGDKFYVKTTFEGQPIKFCDENEDEFYCSFENFEKKAFEVLILEQDVREYCQGKIDNGEDGYGVVWVISTFMLATIVIALILFSFFTKKSHGSINHNVNGYNSESNKKEYGDEEVGLQDE